MEHTSTIKLDLITQEKVLLSQDVSIAVIPSGEGPVGILPGHAPLIGTLNIGVLHARDSSQKEFSVFVGRGFFMVTRERITVVARVAELQDQIDLERAIAAKERAQKQLASIGEGFDREQIKDDLLRAETRIKAAKGTVTA